MAAAKSDSSRLASDKLREQIIGEAARLFSLRGYEGMSINEVADGCKISQATLQQYFPSKEKLDEAVILSLREKLSIDRYLEGLGHEASLENILAGLAHFITKHFGQHPAAMRLLMDCSLRGHPVAGRAFRDLREPFVVFLREKLEEMKRSGEVRDLETEISARCFVGMVMDCAMSGHLWAVAPEVNCGPEEIIRNNVSIYVEGLRHR